MSVTFDGHELSAGDLFLDCRGRLFRVTRVPRMESAYNVIEGVEVKLRRGSLVETGDARTWRTEATVYVADDLARDMPDWKHLFDYVAEPHRAAHRSAIIDRKRALHERMAERGAYKYETG